jgi:hypothetical protein
VKEWCVISSRKNFLEFVSYGIVHLRIWVGAIADAVNVVDVNIAHKVLKFVEQIHAGLGCIWHSHSAKIAVIGLDSVVSLLTVQGVPVSHFNVGGRAVVSVVCNSVADREPLKIGLEN